MTETKEKESAQVVRTDLSSGDLIVKVHIQSNNVLTKHKNNEGKGEVSFYRLYLLSDESEERIQMFVHTTSKSLRGKAAKARAVVKRKDGPDGSSIYVDLYPLPKDTVATHKLFLVTDTSKFDEAISDLYPLPVPEASTLVVREIKRD